MRRSLWMLGVLSLISVISGLALGGLSAYTEPLIADNVLRFKKLPAVLSICEQVDGPLTKEAREVLEEQLLKERVELAVPSADGSGTEHLLAFLVHREGKPDFLVIEAQARGYAGPVVTMVGFDANGKRLAGIGIAAHSETPGVGSRIGEPAFLGQFPGLVTESDFRIKKDGGAVDAVSGATYSSRAVGAAVAKAVANRTRFAEQITAASSAGGK